MELVSSEKEKMLWKMAKERVRFKKHLITYVGVNLFLWALWFLDSDTRQLSFGIPWPAYPSIGWGIGLFFNYLGAYHQKAKLNDVEREYEKLKEKYK